MAGRKDRLDNRQGIFSLWLTWVVSNGAILAVVLSPLLVRPIWIPFVTIVLETALYIGVRHNRDNSLPKCYLIPFITSRALLWSAVAMLVIVILMHDAEGAGKPELPFIPILIVAPITVIIALWRRMAKLKFPFCVDCRLRNGTPAERGFLGLLFTQEGSFQNKVLLLLYAFMTVVGWTYYLFKYVDVNINSADRYFFFIIPTALFVLSAIYMGIRYLGLWNYYEQDILGSEIRRGDISSLRFLLVWGNYIFVRFPNPAGDDMFNPFLSKGDTPASVQIPKQRDVPVNTATQYLKELIPGLKNPEVRQMYSTQNSSGDANTFHYIAFIDDDDHKVIEKAFNNGSWLSMVMLDRLIDENQLEASLSAELYRIYNTVMAWKSYSKDGFRKYRVRHYRPTFRLEDLKKYDVDYNDRRWLYVANDNEDKRFFRIRRWWRKKLQGKDY